MEESYQTNVSTTDCPNRRARWWSDTALAKAGRQREEGWQQGFCEHRSGRTKGDSNALAPVSLPQLRWSFTEEESMLPTRSCRGERVLAGQLPTSSNPKIDCSWPADGHRNIAGKPGSRLEGPWLLVVDHGRTVGSGPEPDGRQCTPHVWQVFSRMLYCSPPDHCASLLFASSALACFLPVGSFRGFAQFVVLEIHGFARLVCSHVRATLLSSLFTSSHLFFMVHFSNTHSTRHDILQQAALTFPKHAGKVSTYLDFTYTFLKPVPAFLAL